MGSTNVSLRDDVYEALEAVKTDEESFSDVIDRLLRSRTGEHPLAALVGVLDEAEADRVRRRIDAAHETSESVSRPP